MKYLLIIGFFFLNPVFAVQSNPSSFEENCAHSTQDIHTVSESSYNKLLAQLTEEDTDDEKPRSQTTRPTKGQR